MMDGPAILVRSLAQVRPIGDSGFVGQYHSRTDIHGRTVCWAILFDLLAETPLLREHAATGRVICGLNHKMGDYKSQEKKALDLVVATPGTSDPKKRKKMLSFKRLGEGLGLALSDAEIDKLNSLPDIKGGPVGTALLALEAKSCMTAHIKALPRLYSELNSSQIQVHGSSDECIAAGVVVVNSAATFMSSDQNPLGLKEPTRKTNKHRMPLDTERTVEKVKRLPRRTRPGEEGFDALGIVVVDCPNDGSPVTLVTVPPSPATSDDYHYDQMIRRAAALYGHRFQGI